jgi:hypothetical protein
MRDGLRGVLQAIGGDEVPDRELFYSMGEAKVLAENWPFEYNHKRPHSSLDYVKVRAYAAACLASAPVSAVPVPNRIEHVENSLIASGP